MYVIDNCDGLTIGPVTREQEDQVLSYLVRQGSSGYVSEEILEPTMLINYEEFCKEMKAVEGSK
jgi:hypothetical protein